MKNIEWIRKKARGFSEMDYNGFVVADGTAPALHLEIPR